MLDKIAVVMLIIPDGMDATLFDNFPKDTMYAKEVIEREDLLDRDKMQNVGTCLWRAHYNRAKFDKQDREKENNVSESSKWAIC